MSTAIQLYDPENYTQIRHSLLLLAPSKRIGLIFLSVTANFGFWVCLFSLLVSEFKTTRKKQK